MSIHHPEGKKKEQENVHPMDEDQDKKGSDGMPDMNEYGRRDVGTANGA